jgi:hypothetical protein
VIAAMARIARKARRRREKRKPSARRIDIVSAPLLCDPRNAPAGTSPAMVLRGLVKGKAITGNQEGLPRYFPRATDVLFLIIAA